MNETCCPMTFTNTVGQVLAKFLNLQNNTNDKKKDNSDNKNKKKTHNHEFNKNTKVKTNHKKLLTFVFCRQDAASEVDMCAFSRRNNSGGIDFVDFAGLILHSVYCL